MAFMIKVAQCALSLLTTAIPQTQSMLKNKERHSKPFSKKDINLKAFNFLFRKIKR